MVVYEGAVGEFRTPRGLPVVMHYRRDTNDWNTLNASMTEDEYGLRAEHLSGLVLDIGAYLGSVAIAMALDNPYSRVLAVEPVPDNARLARLNVARNSVQDRVVILHAAAGGPDDVSVTIRYGYRGEPHLEHHAFVGNTTLAYDYGGDEAHEEEEIIAYSLRDLANFGGDTPSFVKIDCEGGEWAVLSDPLTAEIPIIVGEWHNIRGHTRDEFTALLASHHVTYSGPVGGPGGFRAVRR